MVIEEKAAPLVLILISKRMVHVFDRVAVLSVSGHGSATSGIGSDTVTTWDTKKIIGH